MAKLAELRSERRDHDRGVDRLVGERNRHLGEWQDLDVDVGDAQADGLQHLADLVGRDRAGAVAGDHLALELRRAGDGALEIGPQHQVVQDRRADAARRDHHRQVLLDGVEVAGRDAAGDHLELVLRQQRDGVRGRSEILHLDADAVLLEVAARHGDQQRAVADGADRADAHQRVGMGAGARGCQRDGDGRYGRASSHRRVPPGSGGSCAAASLPRQNSTWRGSATAAFPAARMC